MDSDLGHALAPHLVNAPRSVNDGGPRQRQEDTHEFFLQALGTLGESDDECVQRLWGGQIRSRVECSTCGGTSDALEPILDLSLELHGSSLLSALEHFCQAETLTGDNAYRCERCKALRTAARRVTIEAPPQALVVHLKRFAYQHHRRTKITRHVEFDEHLDLAPFLSADGAAANYRLAGVVVHDGQSSSSGHYYAFVRSADDWFRISDEKVELSSLTTVLQQQAYLLFYEKEDVAASAMRSYLSAAQSRSALTRPPTSASSPGPPRTSSRASSHATSRASSRMSPPVLPRAAPRTSAPPASEPSPPVLPRAAPRTTSAPPASEPPPSVKKPANEFTVVGGETAAAKLQARMAAVKEQRAADNKRKEAAERARQQRAATAAAVEKSRKAGARVKDAARSGGGARALAHELVDVKSPPPPGRVTVVAAASEIEAKMHVSSETKADVMTNATAATAAAVGTAVRDALQRQLSALGETSVDVQLVAAVGVQPVDDSDARRRAADERNHGAATDFARTTLRQRAHSSLAKLRLLSHSPQFNSAVSSSSPLPSTPVPPAVQEIVALVHERRRAQPTADPPGVDAVARARVARERLDRVTSDDGDDGGAVGGPTIDAVRVKSSSWSEKATLLALDGNGGAHGILTDDASLVVAMLQPPRLASWWWLRPAAAPVQFKDIATKLGESIPLSVGDDLQRRLQLIRTSSLLGRITLSVPRKAKPAADVLTRDVGRFFKLVAAAQRQDKTSSDEDVLLRAVGACKCSTCVRCASRVIVAQHYANIRSAAAASPPPAAPPSLLAAALSRSHVTEAQLKSIRACAAAPLPRNNEAELVAAAAAVRVGALVLPAVGSGLVKPALPPAVASKKRKAKKAKRNAKKTKRKAKRGGDGDDDDDDRSDGGGGDDEQNDIAASDKKRELELLQAALEPTSAERESAHAVVVPAAPPIADGVALAHARGALLMQQQRQQRRSERHEVVAEPEAPRFYLELIDVGDGLQRPCRVLVRVAAATAAGAAAIDPALVRAHLSLRLVAMRSASSFQSVCFALAPVGRWRADEAAHSLEFVAHLGVGDWRVQLFVDGQRRAAIGAPPFPPTFAFCRHRRGDVRARLDVAVPQPVRPVQFHWSGRLSSIVNAADKKDVKVKLTYGRLDPRGWSRIAIGVQAFDGTVDVTSSMRDSVRIEISVAQQGQSEVTLELADAHKLAFVSPNAKPLCCALAEPKRRLSWSTATIRFRVVRISDQIALHERVVAVDSLEIGLSDSEMHCVDVTARGTTVKAAHARSETSQVRRVLGGFKSRALGKGAILVPERLGELRDLAAAVDGGVAAARLTRAQRFAAGDIDRAVDDFDSDILKVSVGVRRRAKSAPSREPTRVRSSAATHLVTDTVGKRTKKREEVNTKVSARLAVRKLLVSYVVSAAKVAHRTAKAAVMAVLLKAADDREDDDEEEDEEDEDEEDEDEEDEDEEDEDEDGADGADGDDDDDEPARAPASPAAARAAQRAAAARAAALAVLGRHLGNLSPPIAIGKVPLRSRLGLLRELLAPPSTAAEPKRLRQRGFGYANAHVHAVRVTAGDLACLRGARTESDGPVLVGTFVDADAVLSTLSRSSRTIEALEALTVKGTSVIATVRSTTRARAARTESDCEALQRLAAAAAAADADTGEHWWLLRGLEERIAALYPARSYMSGVLVAWWRRDGTAESLHNMLSSMPKAAAKSESKKAEISASAPHFGLGREWFAELVKAGGVSPTALRCRYVWPQRVLVEGLVGVRHVGRLLELVDQQIFVVGDTGVVTLMSFIVARALPHESGDAWRALRQRAADDELGELDMVELLGSLRFEHVEHKVSACRWLQVRDCADAAARAAAAALSAASAKTGGHRAIDEDRLRRFQRQFVEQFEALYARSTADADAGRANDIISTRKKRRAIEVTAVVQAVAEFRLLRLLRERAAQHDGAPIDGVELDALVTEVFKPATAFDDGVIAFIGTPTFKTSMRGFQSTPAKAFVRELARVFRVFSLSEAYTSQRDWCCGAMLERASATSYRYWFCPHCGVERAFNKDFGACMALLRNGLLLTTTGNKPPQWCTLEQVYNSPLKDSLLAKARALEPRGTKRAASALSDVDAPPPKRSNDEHLVAEILAATEQPPEPPPEPPPPPSPLARQLAAFQADERAKFNVQPKGNIAVVGLLDDGDADGLLTDRSRSSSEFDLSDDAGASEQSASELHTT